ncbi:hypothetical protein LX32DRAFT_26993 [Colletotrichum zoysiae]|uniref:Uncharacterized protein n=1 Tax=Colletotrichum zoysiae TaxID=1216348 RepID=A0AAD9HSW9_9PEZI|nr:hypothetical protein LX32DRAFT_26993 [Colletotrichum zoysiae]
MHLPESLSLIGLTAAVTPCLYALTLRTPRAYGTASKHQQHQTATDARKQHSTTAPQHHSTTAPARRLTFRELDCAFLRLAASSSSSSQFMDPTAWMTAFRPIRQDRDMVRPPFNPLYLSLSLCLSLSLSLSLERESIGPLSAILFRPAHMAAFINCKPNGHSLHSILDLPRLRDARRAHPAAFCQ